MDPVSWLALLTAFSTTKHSDADHVPSEERQACREGRQVRLLVGVAASLPLRQAGERRITLAVPAHHSLIKCLLVASSIVVRS